VKLEALKNSTTEVFVEHDGFSAAANPWANGEGVTVMCHDKQMAQRLAFAVRWEELDVLMVALQAARAA
jgi:hypothetical protein